MHCLCARGIGLEVYVGSTCIVFTIQLRIISHSYSCSRDRNQNRSVLVWNLNGMVRARCFFAAIARKTNWAECANPKKEHNFVVKLELQATSWSKTDKQFSVSSICAGEFPIFRGWTHKKGCSSLFPLVSWWKLGDGRSCPTLPDEQVQTLVIYVHATSWVRERGLIITTHTYRWLRTQKFMSNTGGQISQTAYVSFTELVFVTKSSCAWHWSLLLSLDSLIWKSLRIKRSRREWSTK